MTSKPQTDTSTCYAQTHDTYDTDKYCSTYAISTSPPFSPFPFHLPSIPCICVFYSMLPEIDLVPDSALCDSLCLPSSVGQLSTLLPPIKAVHPTNCGLAANL